VHGYGLLTYPHRPNLEFLFKRFPRRRARDETTPSHRSQQPRGNTLPLISVSTRPLISPPPPVPPTLRWIEVTPWLRFSSYRWDLDHPVDPREIFGASLGVCSMLARSRTIRSLSSAPMTCKFLRTRSCPQQAAERPHLSAARPEKKVRAIMQNDKDGKVWLNELELIEPPNLEGHAL